MIKIEHVILPSPEQMIFVIEGMRNPMNSWEQSDSHIGQGKVADGRKDELELGEKDYDLMMRLARTGRDHRKYLRMMPVYARITAPLYWWKEFDTYKVGTVANSCSTMHKIAAKEFDISDFSVEFLDNGYSDDKCITHTDEIDATQVGIFDLTVITLNIARTAYLETDDKDLKRHHWRQMIQLLPSSYNQTRNVMMNYEVLANMYNARRNHKLNEWHVFAKWIETLPYSELISPYILGVSAIAGKEFLGKEHK